MPSAGISPSIGLGPPPVQPDGQVQLNSPWENIAKGQVRQAPPVGPLGVLNDPRAFGGALAPAADSATFGGEFAHLPRLQDAAADIGSVRGTGRTIAESASALNPAASRQAIFDREALMRQRVASRAAQMNELAARAKGAPSAAAAQTSADLSRAAGARGGMGAGGLLGARRNLARAGGVSQNVSAAAGRRAGEEATGRLAERASYLSGGGQILGTGAGTSLGMGKAGADAERKGVQTQTDLVKRGTTLDRDLAVQQGKTVQAAGNVQLDWLNRRGMAAANAYKNIQTELSSAEKFRRDMVAIEDERQAGKRRQIWTSVPVVGKGLAAASD